LRVVGPVGTNTRVEPLAAEGVFATIPKHHPFADVEAMQRVTDDLQVCLVAVVAHQPGAVSRTTPFGESIVCNAQLRCKNTTIRASFWRTAAQTMADFAQGSAVAIYQGLVKKIGVDQWELRGTQSTRIEKCPPEAEALLRSSTDLTQTPVQVLTRPGTVDYNTTECTPSCIGSLASLIVPSAMRTLEGVFEVHSVSLLGVSSAVSNGNYAMKCCAQCKKQLEESEENCSVHADATVEHRWIAKLLLSDDTGSAEALIYHEPLAASALMPTDCRPLTETEIIGLTRKARSMPWSVRAVFRSSDYQQQNYMEIKVLLPTMTAEGLVSTWGITEVPQVRQGRCSPLAYCRDVQYDKDLGITTCLGRECSACRLWIRLLPEEEDEETAVPDTQLGLRVTRRVACAADVSDKTTYKITVAGLSSGVQWLLKAPDNVAYLVLVSKKGSAPEFVVQGHLRLDAFSEFMVKQYLMDTLQKKTGTVIDMGPTDTPLKRRKLLLDSTPASQGSTNNIAERAVSQSV
jgi:RNA polymerase subunit RPABC4/transcription elongation factor Spt4